MIFRTATLADVANLAAARWAFRAEDATETPIESEQAFVHRYESFVLNALHSEQLVYWVAETADGSLVAHMAVCIVHAIPRPSRLQDQWGYLTDCYTRPAFRNQGIGQALLARVTAWAKDRDLELLLVWPSDLSRTFYARAGFETDDEQRLLRLRDYDAPPAPGQGRRAIQSDERES